jgi:hypothetical protein
MRDLLCRVEDIAPLKVEPVRVKLGVEHCPVITFVRDREFIDVSVTRGNETIERFSLTAVERERFRLGIERLFAEFEK